jgi:hypothetical protein
VKGESVVAKVSQLRLYTIEQGKLAEFVQEWLAGVYPLRQKHGFKVEGAWLLREENKFAWILSYHVSEDWETLDAAYYASPERTRLDPDPARLIVESQHWFASSVLPD